jgi:prepilin-type N-terminal cleavage/methylation domain-containing protein
MKSHTKNERGFTLIEIIIAMVLIGIAVPSIMIPFSGLKDTKHPEYTVQGSFIAQKRIERMADKTQAAALTDCNNGNEGDYSLNCTATTVNASDPDTAAVSTFATKIILTVTRADGAMSPLTFTTLIVQ